MPELYEENARRHPCLILAHADAGYAASTARHLRRLGWDVYRVSDGPEARRLARMLEDAVVVLDADLPGESGWLTCDKLTTERPGIRVVLVADDPDGRSERFASFVGASALVDRLAGPAVLLHELPEIMLPAGR
jgi:DNA-binding response OmpR family regulator